MGGQCRPVFSVRTKGTSHKDNNELNESVVAEGIGLVLSGRSAGKLPDPFALFRLEAQTLMDVL